jgi:hypothetical protein
MSTLHLCGQTTIDLNTLENTLTGLAWYPVVGTLPAAIKVLVGVIQTVVAIATAILFAIPAATGHKSSKALFSKAISYIGHGVANIIAGAFEATPGLGTLCFHIREFKQRIAFTRFSYPINEPTYYRPLSGEEYKFWAYRDRVEIGLQRNANLHAHRKFYTSYPGEITAADFCRLVRAPLHDFSNSR